MPLICPGPTWRGLTSRLLSSSRQSLVPAACRLAALTTVSPTADINILDKNGTELLVLTPNRVLDSTSTIGSVKISNSNFKTTKGISTSSNFKLLADAYEIKKINNLLRSIVVSVKGLNADFIIDKKDLPAELRFDMSLNIEASQIPDEAKIKYIMLYWL